jgi:predicted dehydrogenase
MAPLRIGVLGAARIAPAALIKPARRVDEIEVAAVAARDRTKAEGFARKHGIATVHDSYEAMLADPSIDAIYNPLPNGLHGRWTIAALEAGKHVLCEKPFTANAEEAEAVAAVGARTGLTLMEAFHYRYHPLISRLLEILASGEIGTVEHIETFMCFPLPQRGDIRWKLSLAGGCTMDGGCYAIHMARTLAGAEPAVTSASALTRTPGVDRRMDAQLSFDDGRTGHITASMLSSTVIKIAARVRGSDGELRVFNPVAPQLFNRIFVRSHGSKRVEHATREPTYLFQLRAFAGAVLRGEPFPTDATDAVANMRVIDACYQAAGLEPRRPSA